MNCITLLLPLAPLQLKGNAKSNAQYQPHQISRVVLLALEEATPLGPCFATGAAAAELEPSASLELAKLQFPLA